MKRLAGILGGPAAGALLLTMCSSDRQAPGPAEDPGSGSGETSGWIVTPRGVGPAKFGMGLAEARVALRDSLAGVPADQSCVLLAPSNAPAGLRFMIEAGRLVRVDIDSGPVATVQGARVGMTETEVQSLFGNRLLVTPHKYDPGGKYLIHVPSGPDSAVYRIIFETDSGRVRRYRAGIEPAVEYVERCG